MWRFLFGLFLVAIEAALLGGCKDAVPTKGEITESFDAVTAESGSGVDAAAGAAGGLDSDTATGVDLGEAAAGVLPDGVAGDGNDPTDAVGSVIDGANDAESDAAVDAGPDTTVEVKVNSAETATTDVPLPPSCTSSAACADDNICTDDACDPKVGCKNVPNTTPCDDSNACTLGDLCSSGVCLPGAVTQCEDNKPCTDDNCDKATGCKNVANNKPCDDGNACTLSDLCGGGVCLPGAVTQCDDNKPCTDDNCDKATGCKNVANSKPCDDGNACTLGDLCGGAKCLPGLATVCDDGNSCTTDTCDANKGCQAASTADKTSCGKLLWCKAGICTAVPQCGNGKLEPENGEACDDGNLVSGDGCDAKCKVEPPPAAAGTLVISEVMVNPNVVPDAFGEWIEVFNPTKAPIDMAGWSISTFLADGNIAGSAAITASCGNGAVEASESCDDGNKINGDGCSNLCEVEGQCTSLMLDGKTAYVGVTEASNAVMPLAFYPALTIHGWFLLESPTSGGTCTVGGAATPCSDLFSYGQQGKFVVAVRSANYKLVAVAGDTEVDLGPLTLGKWIHVGVTVEDSMTLRGWLNGRSTGSAAIKGWPGAMASAKTVSLGAQQDAASGQLVHLMKGKVASFQVASGVQVNTSGPASSNPAYGSKMNFPIFWRNFGPQVRWAGLPKGDVLSLGIDEGAGTSLKDASVSGHAAGAVAAAWATEVNANASGPYCALGGKLLADTGVLTPGFDAYVVNPGDYRVLSRVSAPVLNNGVKSMFSWTGSGTFAALGNGDFNFSLINPDGKVVDAIKYLADWPFSDGGSMYVKDGCLDTLLNDSKNCWASATGQCAYGPYFNTIGASLAPCNNSPCTIGGEFCAGVPKCGAGGASCLECVFKDRGTPGEANVCQ